MVSAKVFVNVLEELLFVGYCSLDTAFVYSDSFFVYEAELLVAELLVSFGLKSGFFAEFGQSLFLRSVTELSNSLGLGIVSLSSE